MDPIFEVHKGIDKAESISFCFDNLMTQLAVWCPPGREFSIVKTKLEEACFFAKKAMAFDPANHADPVKAENA